MKAFFEAASIQIVLSVIIFNGYIADFCIHRKQSYNKMQLVLFIVAFCLQTIKILALTMKSKLYINNNNT